MAEEEIILRFEGQDDVSPVIERIAALLDNTVVSVDDLVAAGFRMEDITAALDGIAGAAGTAGTGLAGMAAMTKESALALGQANDIAGQMATVVDTLTQASMSDAQAFAELTAQTRMLSEAQNMAFAALDRATASETAQEQAMAGLGQAITDVNDQINLFAESTTASTDRAAVYTMAIGRAATETSAFAQEQLSLAERMSAGSDTIGMLSDKVTQLAVAEGLAVDITAPLAESFTALSGALDVSARATQSLAEAQAMSFQAAADLQARLAALRLGLTGTADDLAILRVAFQTTFDTAALQGAGYSLEAINKAMSGLLAEADPAAVALALVSSRLDDVAAAALVAGDALAKDAINMVEAADATRILAEAKERAAAAAYEMAVAEGMDATTIAILKEQMLSTAMAAQELGTSEEESGAKAGVAADAMMMLKMALFMVGTMAAFALVQMAGAAMQFQDTMVVIQGATQASDQQMQQWTETLKTMASQGVFTLDVLSQALLTVAKSGFQATDATDVLQQAMELAQTTQSSLSEGTNLLVTSLNAYGQSSASATTYANILYNAWAHGKQSLQDLTQMLGSTIDTAAAAGISFQDLVTAETLFSKSSVDSSIAARDFQTFIAAIASDSSMTAAQVAKLSQTFDSAKFATLDWAGKLEMLGKISGNNVREFNQLIGGADAAKNALAILGISTDQLAKNAKAAGLSFDPILYNSLKTASEKLLYLDQVSGGSEAHLKKLTVDGVHPLNDALAALDLKVSDVAGQFAKTHPAFNQAAFDSLDLKGKLLMLWDAVGHSTAAFAPFIGGVKNLGIAANIMGVDLNDASTSTTHLSAQQDILKNKLQSASSQMKTTSTDAQNLQKNYDKQADDLKTKNQQLQTSFSNLADSITRSFGPSLSGIFVTLSKAVDEYAKEADKGNTSTNAFGITQNQLKSATDGSDKSIQGLTADVKWLGQAMKDADTWTNNALTAIGNFATGVYKALGEATKSMNDWTNNAIGSIGKFVTSVAQSAVDLWNEIGTAFSTGAISVQQTITTFIQGVIDKFLHLKMTVIGGSIVPDMINGISSAFSGAGPVWNSIVQGALTTIEGTFTSAQGTLTSIANTIGSDVDSAFSTAGSLWQGTVDSAMSTVVSTVQGWVGAAMSAGAAVGNAIGDGLNSAVGWVKQAAGNIAGAIASILHHSTPETGPLRGDDQWGQHFGDAFASGMLSSVDKLRTASLQMASSIGSNLVVNTVNTPVLGGGVGVSRDGNSSLLLSQILTTLQEIARQQGSTNVTSGPSVTNMFSGTLMPGISQTQMWQIINAVGGMMMESGARGATQQGAR